MNNRTIGRRKILGALAICSVALLFLTGCAPIADAVSPPQAPEGISGVELNTTPEAIALTRLDMPAGFQLAAEQSLGAEYGALYLRPSALEPDTSGGNSLMSVLISVGVYPTIAEAESIYLAASGDPREEAIEDISLTSGAATEIVTAPFEGAVQGADASEAFQVSYRLMNRPVYEYGHRFRLGNVLAYVVVAAVGDQDEPQHLLEDARNLVQRQVDHIAAAIEQPTTE